MAAPALASILRSPSTLVWNGTTIGESHDIEFTPNPKLREIWAEELGLVADVIYAGERVLVNATLRYPDSDAISAICPNSSGTTYSYNATGSKRAGTSLYTRAGTLVITPRASSQNSVTLNKAIPMISEGALLRYAWNREWGLTVVFYGTLGTAGAVYTA